VSRRSIRETWPPFFTWQAQGAAFEIVDLRVTAGHDVAFAHAVLRCGMPDELRQDPDNRLRLTMGLRKEHGRWIVAHEHHSFPLKNWSTRRRAPVADDYGHVGPPPLQGQHAVLPSARRLA
jgi:uncharacterized protein (TIGR02246 family)